MILLDTNALIWLAAGHRRARPLERRPPLRLARVDEPPARAWFDEARALGWTRDPFDRLIVAHALERGLRLATADASILERLPSERTLEL